MELSKNQLCTSHDIFLSCCMLLFENVYLVMTMYHGKYIHTYTFSALLKEDGGGSCYRSDATDLGRMRGPCLERKEPPHGG